ncbi:hypothetical protein Tco_0672720 [Tanacetum coccineum]
MVESSKKKKLNKFDFVTEEGDHVHFTEEQIKEQKSIEESVKADLAKKEEVVGKEELIDLLGIYVKGPITLKVFRDDGTDEVIPNFKASDLHLSEWREVMQACPKRTRAGWTTNYEQIKTRMENMSTKSSASALQVLRTSSSIFTSVYVVVQKLKKTLARASVQLGWQFQAERCRSPLRS